jgi:hypothetical protein
MLDTGTALAESQSNCFISSSVPNPDPDPRVFGPPGSISQRYGSGSFYH